MTKGDGRPCKRCGTSNWYQDGCCVQCKKEGSRRHYLENTEDVLRRTGHYQRANPERTRGYTRRWRQDNPEKQRECVRRWAKEHPEVYRAKTSRRKTQKTQAGGSYTPAEWIALCDLYDNKCLCCGHKKPLTFDHVIPIVKGGTSDISNGQPLCLSCNSRKKDRVIDYRTKKGIRRWIQKGLFDD